MRADFSYYSILYYPVLQQAVFEAPVDAAAPALPPAFAAETVIDFPCGKDSPAPAAEP
jgi:hypothetical protein